MLTITIPAIEQWDEENQEFINVKEQTLALEHSLVSLSKWESKWNKPFFSKQEKTTEETIDYIRCMTLTKHVLPTVYDNITNDNFADVLAYIEYPMTATKFFDDRNSSINRETITSELIYYWMIALNIPFECQKWHLNRLLTLVRVCNVKNAPPKKRSRGEILNRNAAINAARKKQLNTNG